MIPLSQSDRRALWIAGVLALVLTVAFALALPDKTHADNKPAAPPKDTVLRVCADPNNLPFTDAQGQGFENKIAELLAADLHERLEYTWWRQTRNFFRNTLDANRCDVVLGVPSRYPKALVTAPYYTSTYVFVTRKDRKLRIESINDP
jgi:mxaJ protein